MIFLSWAILSVKMKSSSMFLIGQTMILKKLVLPFEPKTHQLHLKNFITNYRIKKTLLKQDDTSKETRPITAQLHKKFSNHKGNSEKSSRHLRGNFNHKGSTNDFGKEISLTISEKELFKVIIDSPIKTISIPNRISIPQHSWRPNNGNNQCRIICQLCNKISHSAKVCRSRPPPSFSPQANYMASDQARDHSTQIVDSGASHHITFDFQNFSLHFEYGGNEDIMIDDGNDIPITHVGSIILDSSTTIFSLDNVLCEPLIKNKKIFFLFINSAIKINFY